MTRKSYTPQCKLCKHFWPDPNTYDGWCQNRMSKGVYRNGALCFAFPMVDAHDHCSKFQYKKDWAKRYYGVRKLHPQRRQRKRRD